MTAHPDGSRISHYRVAGELGRDALGPVLSALDEMLDRPVALKVVRTVDAYPADFAAEARQRFTRNAQRAARVVHPNVVTIYGYEQIGDADVLAMELVEGETLQAWLARGERWRALDAATLVARIADGVAAAHARHLVHGRLGLRNVKLRPDGRVKILDLGVPKASGSELAAYVSAAAGDAPTMAEPTVAQDVAALARIACHLVTGALRPAEGTASPGAKARQPMFPDPARVLPNLGVLAPPLARALTPTAGAAFADAGAFRDALLEVLETARRRSDDAPAEHGGHTNALPGRSPGMRGGVILEAEGRLASMDGFAGETRRPALVLPADLAANAHAPPPGTFVVMSEGRPLDGLRAGAAYGAGVLARAPRVTIVAALSLVVLLAAAGIALRLRSGNASAATVDGEEAALPAPPSLVTTVAASTPVPAAADGSVEAMVATLDSVAAAMPPVRTARVAARPAGTAITLFGGEGGPWLDAAELSVKEGDSLVLRFVRPGYVARTAVFRGAPVDVALLPDSVIVRFDANVQAEVYLLGSGGVEPRLLGTTELAVRLPTGAHRIVFRAANQDDWLVTRRFDAAGDTYTVQKTDYATTGDLVATAVGGWAWISLDGGEEHETPHRFQDLALGRHVLRLRRDGFRTIVDTVDVRGGQALTRQYTLVRNP